MEANLEIPGDLAIEMRAAGGACDYWQHYVKARAVPRKDRMDKTIRKYTNFDEMKADEYRYWQSRPVHERIAAVWELTREVYTLKGLTPDAFRLQKSIVHFQFAPR